MLAVLSPEGPRAFPYFRVTRKLAPEDKCSCLPEKPRLNYMKVDSPVDRGLVTLGFEEVIHERNHTKSQS